MSTQSFRELFEEARQRDTYWEERAVLEFTEEVYRRMEDLGLTKRQLAERLGTSAAYVTKVLGGDANFTLRTMVRLARALESNVQVHLEPGKGRGRGVGGREPDSGPTDYSNPPEEDFVPAVAEPSGEAAYSPRKRASGASRSGEWRRPRSR